MKLTKKNAFTPGPWSVHKKDPNWLHKNGHLIAMVSDSNGDRNITPRTEANAQLIAAAPEMLALLTDLWAATENGTIKAEFFGLRSRYRNIIAKARGES